MRTLCLQDLVVVALALTACGNDEIVPADGAVVIDATADAPAIDAAMNDAAIDAAMIDAPIDAAVDAPPDAMPAQGCIVSPSSVFLPDDDSALVTISLALPPASSVDVPISIEDTTVAVVATAMLNFTPGNYAQPRSVRIDGVRDIDILSETTSLICAVPGATPTSTPIWVEDRTHPAIETTVSTLQIYEYSTGTFGVRVTAMLPAPITITVESLDVGAATVSPASITIVPAEWQMLHTVTVSGVADADILEEMVTVQLTATGLPPRTVTVRVTDDD